MKLAKTTGVPEPADSEAQSPMEARRRAWQQAATTAFEAAREDLLAKGIGYVYARDGIVYRRMPDGSEQIVSSPKAS